MNYEGPRGLEVLEAPGTGSPEGLSPLRPPQAGPAWLAFPFGAQGSREAAV